MTGRISDERFTELSADYEACLLYTSDNRKYYYLKLKESYFDDDAIVLLESMPDGILYRSFT